MKNSKKDHPFADLPEKKAEDVSAGDMVPKKEYDAVLSRLNELEAMKEQLLRAAADFENAKKRLAREREEFVKFSQENLIRGLLPVLDNMERALNHAASEDPNTLKGIVTGLEMVVKQFQDILKNEGLKKLQTAGQKFDPHLHETVGYVQEDGPEDMIVDEVAPGYQFHDRLLRAAKVRVRMSPTPPPSSSGEAPLKDNKNEELT